MSAAFVDASIAALTGVVSKPIGTYSTSVLMSRVSMVVVILTGTAVVMTAIAIGPTGMGDGERGTQNECKSKTSAARKT